MSFLGPREKDALPFVLIVVAAFVLGLTLLVISISVGP
jgi:hypothetical protein